MPQPDLVQLAPDQTPPETRPAATCAPRPLPDESVQTAPPSRHSRAPAPTAPDENTPPSPGRNVTSPANAASRFSTSPLNPRNVSAAAACSPLLTSSASPTGNDAYAPHAVAPRQARLGSTRLRRSTITIHAAHFEQPRLSHVAIQIPRQHVEHARRQRSAHDRRFFAQRILQFQHLRSAEDR